MIWSDLWRLADEDGGREDVDEDDEEVEIKDDEEEGKARGLIGL